MRKIKNYFIYPRFQLALIGLNFIIWPLSFGTLYYYTIKSLNIIKELGPKMDLPPDHVFYNFVKVEMSEINFVAICSLLVAMFCTCFFIVLFSHRLAGPVIRLRNHLQNYLATREFQLLKFRKNDYFKKSLTL